MVRCGVHPLLQIFVQDCLLINQSVLLQQLIQHLLNLIILLLNISLVRRLSIFQLGLELADLCALVVNIILQLSNLELFSFSFPINTSLLTLGLLGLPLPLAPLVLSNLKLELIDTALHSEDVLLKGGLFGFQGGYLGLQTG